MFSRETCHIEGGYFSRVSSALGLTLIEAESDDNQKSTDVIQE